MEDYNMYLVVREWAPYDVMYGPKGYVIEGLFRNLDDAVSFVKSEKEAFNIPENCIFYDGPNTNYPLKYTLVWYRGNTQYTYKVEAIEPI